ncbi:MAG TPA: sulfite exporter TauE/SafE family protein [Acidimicrobiales bacterium]|nr:sulfite exporter TauE/SafE family protein [Acidimicrobiales bacterium]
MRALVASPFGFLIGLSLGAFGAGGSVLAVPVLVYAAGQGARAATATSLVVVGAAAVVGMVAHWRAGRVRVGLGILFGLAGVGGSLVGSAVNRQLPGNWLLLGFSVLVVVAAWRMLVGCPTCTRVGEQRELLAADDRDSGSPDGTLLALRHRVDTKAILGVLGAGTAIGFLTGLFGVGGGFVIIPALTLLLGLSMPDAIGTSLLVIAINSASALAARLATTSIDWTVTLPFALAAIAGVIAGRRLGSRLDPERSLRWFAALLVAVGVYTAISAGVALAG